MIELAIKAVGEWELDVLGVPFDSVDSYGQWFTAKTDIMSDTYPNPPVMYYHGLSPSGVPEGDPEVIGKVASIEKRADGWWYRVVLDGTKALAKTIWDAASAGKARASTGSVVHMARLLVDGVKKMFDPRLKGEIVKWPVIELSLIDADGKRQPANKFAVALPVMKSHYQIAGVDMPEAESPAAESAAANQNLSEHGENEMEPEAIAKMVQEQLAAALKSEREAHAAEEAQKAEIEARAKEIADAAIKAEREEFAKANRLVTGMPHVKKFGEIDRYDNLSLPEQATLVTMLGAIKDAGRGPGAGAAALKALAVKALEGKDELGAPSMRGALKAAGVAIKSDEVMQQDLASYGDEWVGVGYSTQLWESIRNATFVLPKLPQREVPQGQETVYEPLEGADPTWYKVAETTATDSTSGYPVASVTASKVGTSRVSPTLSKAGARTLWSGELDEDSLIPVVGDLQRQFAVSAQEMLEQVIIDGDNVTTAATNINDIAATGAQTGTEIYLLFDGFRVSPLVTTSANSRSAAGGFVVSDFIETLRLMGGSGMNALDQSKVGFIIDPSTHWKALDLAEVKTRDVFAMPTIENGRLVGIYGYDVNVSTRMHASSTTRLANSAGKVDQDTVGNNLYGAILAVRYDQWKFYWKRRIKTTVEYVSGSDHFQITSLLRCSLAQRDTEASAVTYYVGV